ncbi:hypothetical protein ACOMHN_051620 [Nucella lapillus]
MVKLQSPRVQCCMCVLSVMSALLGMFMLSAGVCLVLNYNFLEVDTSGLPPDLHNDEGKKVVGIILICVGVAALGLSGLVSTLFYAACARTSSTSPSSAKDAEGKGQGQGRPGSQEGQGRGHYHSNGSTNSQVRGAGPGVSGGGGGRRSNGVVGMGAGGAMPNGRRGNDPRGARGPTLAKDVGGSSHGRNGSMVPRGASAAATPPGAARPYHRSGGKKARHGQPGRFRNSLPSHPEEDGGRVEAFHHSHPGSSTPRHSLDAPSNQRRRTLAFPHRSGHDNQGAQLDDDHHGGSAPAACAAESSVTPSVVIQVDSSYLTKETSSPSQTNIGETKNSSGSSKQCGGVGSGGSGGGGGVGSGDVSSTLTSGLDQNDNTESSREGGQGEESEEGGRMSKCSVESSETGEGVEISPEEAKQRLDSQMKSLIS